MFTMCHFSRKSFNLYFEMADNIPSCDNVGSDVDYSSGAGSCFLNTKMVTRYSLLIRHARQIVCMSAPYIDHTPNVTYFKKGAKEMNELSVMEDIEGGLDIIVGSDGRIVDICTDQAVVDQYVKGQSFEDNFEQILDGRNCSIIPGFVDCHTHSCYAGDRLNEFIMKLQGATYLEVHRMGGGIHFTVKCTRAASEDELFADLKKRLLSMLSCGTTTVEVKSGYGLDTATELKMLRVVNRARRELAGKMDVIATFCGAHAVPQGDNAEDSTNRVINEMLPAILEARSSDIKIDGGIDAFCERGIFENEHTRRILDYAKKLGIRGNFHGDELSCTNSAELGVEMKARAVSHLEEISDAGIAALAKSAETNEPTVGVLLPTTAYLLRLKVPPARRMIDAGGCVALATDFNPNAYCYNMPLVMNMACVLLKMTPAEALVATTVNSAAALGVSDSRGSLGRGRLADFIVIDSPRWENIIYQVGCSHELIRNVVKAGQIVYTKPKIFE